MQKYVIKSYQNGFEQDQVRIGLETARHWIWPYAYRLEGLQAIHAQPDFDPHTRHYCFLEGEMVGYIVSIISRPRDGELLAASLDFPRMMPGHEQAAVLLIEYAVETLKKRGVSRVTGRVTTMCPGDIRLAEEAGFYIHDWGYKVYYSYEMTRGRLGVASGGVEEIDPGNDLEECAGLAARWYQRPVEWCRSLLQDWHAEGIITHVCLRREGRMTAACMTAPNDVRPSTAANYYIHVPDEDSLMPLLAHVVDRCIEFGVHDLIADLIHDHRRFEPVYRKLGFRKAAEWARCELELG
jgi:hypothetical protein